MRVWCRGHALGDFSLTGCALFPAYGEFRTLPDWLPEHWDPAFNGLTGTEIYELLEGAFWAEVDRSLSIGGRPEVGAGGTVLRLQRGGAVREVPLPLPVQVFLDGFHRGLYPDLEEPAA